MELEVAWWPVEKGCPGHGEGVPQMHISSWRVLALALWCLNPFIPVTGKAPALRGEGASLLLFLSPPPSAAPPFL